MFQLAHLWHKEKLAILHAIECWMDFLESRKVATHAIKIHSLTFVVQYECCALYIAFVLVFSTTHLLVFIMLLVVILCSILYLHIELFAYTDIQPTHMSIVT